LRPSSTCACATVLRCSCCRGARYIHCRLSHNGTAVAVEGAEQPSDRQEAVRHIVEPVRSMVAPHLRNVRSNARATCDTRHNPAQRRATRPGTAWRRRHFDPNHPPTFDALARSTSGVVGQWAVFKASNCATVTAVPGKQWAGDCRTAVPTYHRLPPPPTPPEHERCACRCEYALRIARHRCRASPTRSQSSTTCSARSGACWTRCYADTACAEWPDPHAVSLLCVRRSNDTGNFVDPWLEANNIMQAVFRPSSPLGPYTVSTALLRPCS
jgi:hypothetical protein